ncbi:VolA/Pla-1 family phospholipase [Alteromonas sp. a30]|uniref:VolA/Pla-1 family phospholipase n=1 Tax=Alteromonas sp. a30 TaxID=2730917 RepID=UPI00227E8687|nr:VolA/Pla-1 family phospholipase [Alteromonas sp. a30]MCY7294120.1 lipase [Alteromonas sp. a30]
MKKLLVSSAIAATLGLSGCGGGGEALTTVQEETPDVKPFARIIFDPANGSLNVPNDLLTLPSGNLFDFTLETEADTFDPADPQQALGVLDGWSTQHPFVVNINLPDGLEIDGNSASIPGAIRLFEATQALEGTTATCQGIAAAIGAPGVPCEIGEELTFGADFVTQKVGPGAVSIVPLKPLKPGQGYVLVVTDTLQDTEGKGVRGSETWELVRQDIDTLPLATDAQRQIQGLVNAIVDPIEALGVPRSSISYAAYFSTQSAGVVVNTVKQLQIGGFAQAFATALAQGADQATAAQAAAQFLPVVQVNDAPVDTAFDVLAPSLLSPEQLAQLGAVGLNTCDGLMAALANPAGPLFPTAASTFAQVGSFCASSLKAGSVNLPHYLSTTNPLGDWWRAACTNGAMLRSLGEETVGSLVAADAVGPNNDLCQAASGGQLLDLNLAAVGIDDPRNLTKVSPVPARSGTNPDGTETVSVQVTVPDTNVVNTLAALSDSVNPISKPESGWPVVVIQHGITSKKEDVLALTGSLSLAGFATVAIDHPLHGSRGYTIDGEVINASSGFGGSPTDYLNLSSLVTARDNLRQSIVDTLGLRLGLNAVVDLTGGSVDLDENNVYFVGQSLGSITGIGTVANANNTLGGDLSAFDGMYEFKAAVLSVPGGGIASFLLDSPSFGPLIKGSLLAASSTDFQAFLGQFAQQNGLSPEQALVPAFQAFVENLNAQQLAEINSTFSSFAFAAQTIIDAGDPNNYAALLASNTPILVHEVVGGGTNDDGSTALPDQVIPNTAAVPLAGTEPLAALMGLQGVSSTTQGSGLVRFIAGGHGSLLSPADSLAATTEMQLQTITFLATQGETIAVTDTSVVAN